MSSDVDASADVVVISTRLLPLDFFLSLGNSSNSSQIFAELTLENSATPPLPIDPESAPPAVSLEDGITLTPAEEQVRARMIARIIAISTRIGQIPDALSKSFVPKNGAFPVTLDEIYSNLLNLDFELTKNASYPDGYGGSLVPVLDGWLSSIKVTTLTGYDAHGTKGLNYLILHELAHTLPQAEAYYMQQYSLYIARSDKESGFSISIEFQRNENYSNSLAKAIGDLIDLPAIDEPPFGY